MCKWWPSQPAKDTANTARELSLAFALTLRTDIQIPMFVLPTKDF